VEGVVLGFSPPGKIEQNLIITKNLDYAQVMSDRESVKNYTATLILVLVTGFIGGHRFYVGKVFTGVLFFATIGFFGIGWIIDIITVAVGNFTDKTGRFIRPKPKAPDMEGKTP